MLAINALDYLQEHLLPYGNVVHTGRLPDDLVPSAQQFECLWTLHPAAPSLRLIHGRQLTFRAFLPETTEAKSQHRLKRELRHLFRLGLAAKPLIDRLLDCQAADPLEDLRTTLRLAAPARWVALRQALRAGQWVTRRYTTTLETSEENGCLAFLLFDFTCNEDMLASSFPDAATLCAVSRTIRNVDYGILTGVVVEQVLEREFLGKR